MITTPAPGASDPPRLPSDAPAPRVPLGLAELLAAANLAQPGTVDGWIEGMLATVARLSPDGRRVFRKLLVALLAAEAVLIGKDITSNGTADERVLLERTLTLMRAWGVPQNADPVLGKLLQPLFELVEIPPPTERAGGQRPAEPAAEEDEDEEPILTIEPNEAGAPPPPSTAPEGAKRAGKCNAADPTLGPCTRDAHDMHINHQNAAGVQWLSW